MITHSWKLLAAGLCAAIALTSASGCRDKKQPAKDEPFAFKRRPVAIMSTDVELTAVALGQKEKDARAALEKAEQVLRDVEIKMSSWIESTELYHFNNAPAGKEAKLSESTMGLLRLSKQLAKQTDGAFDVTCRPILQLWRRAKKSQTAPGNPEIAAAVLNSGWENIELRADSAVKKIDEASVDLGGIAKGYGIDQAVEVLQQAGMLGAMVNAGGDVRCFGQRDEGGNWRIGVRNPFEEKLLGVVEIPSGSVCTSGNYERFSMIGSKRYSHIVDPRTGKPVDKAPSVTVVARTAVIADAWATALSVLGEPGLELIGENSGIEAMLVIGEPDNYRLAKTPGFDKVWKPF